MRFSRQPNGKWCGFSTISESFYHVQLTDEQLVAAVVSDTVEVDAACGAVPNPGEAKQLKKYLHEVANRCAKRIAMLLENGGYDFDRVIDQFSYDNDQKQTRAFWIRRFTYMGCSKEQLARVSCSIDCLADRGDLRNT